MLPQLLTAQQVCDALQISDRTLRRIVQGGRLLQIRLRKSVRFRADDVRRLIDGASHAP